jgi:hypothetical protein
MVALLDDPPSDVTTLIEAPRDEEIAALNELIEHLDELFRHASRVAVHHDRDSRLSNLPNPFGRQSGALVPLFSHVTIPRYKPPYGNPSQ